MSAAGLIARLFGRGAEAGAMSGKGARDGAAAVLEAHATGLPAGLLDPGRPERPEAGGSAGRRSRALLPPGEALTEVLAGKVLNGWMQNRLQTLYPLTVNLRRLDAGSARLLARAMAAAMLAGGRRLDDGRIGDALAWLGRAGGDAATAQALRDALERPDPLGALLQRVGDAGLSALAYAVSLPAVDARDQAGQLYLDYLAVRLGLPTSVVRSADRRYRRRRAAPGVAGQASSASSVRAANAP